MLPFFIAFVLTLPTAELTLTTNVCAFVPSMLPVRALHAARSALRADPPEHYVDSPAHHTAPSAQHAAPSDHGVDTPSYRADSPAYIY